MSNLDSLYQIAIERGVYCSQINNTLLLTYQGRSYIFYPSTNQWRNRNGDTLYSCKGIEDLLDRFICK